MYPVIPREYNEKTRGQIAIDEPNCILCGICDKKCPTDAISVSKEDRTWTINRMQCIQCLCCVDVCPKQCLSNVNLYVTPDTKKIIDKHDIPEAEKKTAADGAATDGGATSGSGELECDTETCIYCGICAKKCPEDALTVTRAKKNKETGEMEGENSWAVDHEACIKCGICVEACPKDSLTL